MTNDENNNQNDEPEVQVNNPSRTRVPDTAGEKSPEQIQVEEGRVMAMLAYAIWPIPYVSAKDNPFVLYHLRQGALLLVGFAGAIVLRIIGWILPDLLGTAFVCLTGIAAIAILAFAVIGAMNAYKGAKEPLPLIGGFADKVPI